MEIYGENDSFTTWEAAGSCTSCHYILPRLVDCAPTYFKDGYVACEKCGQHVDLWQAVFGRAATASLALLSLESLGTAATRTHVTIETWKYCELDLTACGVPPDARILHVCYTPGGGPEGVVGALEWHGNSPAKRRTGTLLRLVGIPLGEGAVPRSGSVGVFAIWIRGEPSDAWPYLMGAFEAAAANEYAPSLVFAQSAVEISMMPAIAARLRRHSSHENVKRFVTDALTYSYALNVVLPYMCGELGLPRLPDPVRAALNKLRKRRNAIIHQGVKAVAISHKEAAEGLSAAAFGFEYIRYILPLLAA